MTDPQPTQLQQLSSEIFFVSSIISGILAFILFSGAFRPQFPVNPWFELFTVIFSIAMIVSGVTDLAVNHTGIEIANILAVVFVVIAVVEVITVTYLFELTNYGVTYHISATDFPLGIVLATALIVFALTDFLISHSPIRSS